MESLLKPENKAKHQAILTYDVVPGKVMVDRANVVKTDIACSNGVIHVIDSVILPADKDIVDRADCREQLLLQFGRRIAQRHATVFGWIRMLRKHDNVV